MADSLLRQTMADDKTFKLRCEYYFYERSREVFDLETPAAVDLAFAKAIWAGQVAILDMTKAVITNSSVGANIDAGTAISESDIEWVVKTDDKFNDLANSYLDAGLITVV